LVELLPIRRQDDPAETQAAVLDLRQSGDWRAAGAVESRQERAFAGHGIERLGVPDRREAFQDRCVVGAAGNRDGALPAGRRKPVEREIIIDAVFETEPLQSCGGEKRRVILALLHLAEPGLHVAAEKRDPEVGPDAAQERLPPERRRSHRRSLWEGFDGAGLAADEGVADIGAWKVGGDGDAARHEARHVLGRMDGGVDLAGEKRLIDLLGEKTLATRLQQRAVADDVAGGSDDDNLGVRFGIRGGERVADGTGLPQREPAAARADPNPTCLQLQLR
jgi:hypothetical protein